MTRDDIIRMAWMSADYWANHYDRKSKADMELLRKHVAKKFLEIAASEREECAKVCDEQADEHAQLQEFYELAAVETLADAIRERGEA